ncbi:Phosphatidylinositol N-acetyglucosaminlytransferase subunit P-related [Euphorbia peplus]|nr:Phosphatidylinositol N-acetyglucosaminlytransferase subunit P-related [Euphorbia peplus]
MAKSKKRPVRQERDQSGCMWGLISMFDFRHGRTTQKLISDKRRATRPVSAAGKVINKPDLLIDLDENCQVTTGTGESIVGGNKPSVKKLMEKEMYCEEDIKKEINVSEGESTRSNPEDRGSKKKSRKRTNKNRTKSGEIYVEDTEDAHNVELEKQSTCDIDMDVLMEEFFRQIDQISCRNHGQNEENYNRRKQENPDFEEKLSEAIKFFISQRLINGKRETGDADIRLSKELMDALKILSSDEELSLKLLQGPKSVLVQYFENLWNAQVEKDEISKPPVGSNSSEQEIQDLKQPKVTHSKERNFFRRKAKSKADKVSQGSKTIVILKPTAGPSEKPDPEGSQRGTPESQSDTSNKGPNERVGSHFFLTEIKRRLKQAMGKEQHEMSPNGVSKKFFKEHQAKGDDVKRYKENSGRKSSPSKDRFFVEKIARPPIGMKKGEKTDKLKDHATAIYPRQRLSNIYMEAKKHLSEMFTSGTPDSGVSNRQVPKSLGRILSLPEYSFSPVGSPGRDWGQGYIAGQTRLSASDKFPKSENNVNRLGQDTRNSDSQLGPSSDSTCIAEAFSNSNTRVSHEIVDREVEITSCPIEEGMTSQGDVDVAKTTEILVLEDSKIEPDDSVMIRHDQNADESEVCDQKGFSECSEHDLHEEHQSPPSILTSPPSAPVNKKEYNLDGAADVLERWSPVSVLEPLFIDEDISPASIRSHPADLPIQPLRIKFEELVPSAADLGAHSKACIHYEDLIFEYVKAVLQASELNWDEFYTMSNSSDPLLDPSIFDEIGFLPNQLCNDKQLLFDCINEGLMEVYGRYFGFPLGLSFTKSTTRPAPDLKHAIHEVWRGVCWYLRPLPVPRTLDQIVKKDMSKNGTWMDMQFDCEAMIVEIGEAIFSDLLEETMLSCIDGSSENRDTSILVEQMDEICIDS